jgi:hypothetical protein
MPAIVDEQCAFTINDTRGWKDVTTAHDRSLGLRVVLESPTRARLTVGVGPTAGVGEAELDRAIGDYLRQVGGRLISKGSIEVAGIREFTFTYQIRTKITKRYVIVQRGYLGIPGIDDFCCEISISAYPYDRERPLSSSEESDADAIVKSITFQKTQQQQQPITAEITPDGKLKLAFNPQYNPVSPPDVWYSPRDLRDLQYYPRDLPDDPNDPKYAVRGAIGCFVIVAVVVLSLWWQSCHVPPAQQEGEPNQNVPAEESPK